MYCSAMFAADGWKWPIKWDLSKSDVKQLNYVYVKGTVHPNQKYILLHLPVEFYIHPDLLCE